MLTRTDRRRFPVLFAAIAVLALGCAALAATFGLFGSDGPPSAYAQTDTTAPTISSVAITSDPDENDADLGAYEHGGPGRSSPRSIWASGVYRIGDDVEVTVTFSENVAVTGSPELELAIGSNNRTAEYDSTDGSAAIFRYTVSEGDSDSDGIAIGANKLTLNGGSIKDAADNDASLAHNALPAQDGHKVDGVRPRLMGVRFLSSSDGSDGAYSAGEELMIIAEFNSDESGQGPIRGSASAQVKIDLGDKEKAAAWDWSLRFNDTRENVAYFAYVVQEGDLDRDGPAISANSVELNGGFIRDAAGNDAVLTHEAVATGLHHIVDAVAPTVSSIAITSDPGDDDTYGSGDKIEVTVTFSENMSFPISSSCSSHVVHCEAELELAIGGTARTAAYRSHDGAEAIYAYTVQAGDSDDDGISIGADKLTGQRITDAAGRLGEGINDADLSHDAVAADSGHKVDGGSSSALTVSGDVTIRIQENRPTYVARYEVSGRNGSLTWSLTGDDSDDFTIIGGLDGLVNFRSSPNFEAPTDADADNEYEFTVNASDDMNDASLHVTVVVTNERHDADELPVITGTAQVGQTLTVDNSPIGGTDENTTFYYAWYRTEGDTDTHIDGATSSSYTVTAADEGKTIKVAVTFRTTVGERVSLTSAPTTAVAGAAPAVSGAPSYITVEVTADYSDPINIVTNFTITWNDADVCSVDYNAYLNIKPSTLAGDVTEESQLHLGSAASDGAQITAGLTGVQGGVRGFDVELYCGTDGSGRLVSRVVIPGEYTSPEPGTYSSEPPLSALSVSHGTMTPTFQGGTWGYAVPDVANAETRITITATPTEGNFVKFFEGADSPVISLWIESPGQGPRPSGLSEDCSRAYNDYYGPLIEMTDADPDTPGFQVDLYDGTSYVRVHVYPTAVCSPGRNYALTITRAEGEISLPRPNRPAIGLPLIAPASPCVGCTMNAHVSSIKDRDGWDESTFSYQWLADDAEITGATDSSYTAADTDLGKTLKVRVSFTDGRGNEETLTSHATEVVRLRNFLPTGKPVILGTAEVGQTLRVDVSNIKDRDGWDESTFSYQWLADDAEITGATDFSYLVADTDLGKTLKVRVSFTDGRGNEETLTSHATRVVRLRNFLPTGKPVILGTAEVGQTLRVDVSGISDPNGMTNAAFTYQWMNTGWTESNEYTLADRDEGRRIWLQAAYTDDAGHRHVLESASTGRVAARPSSTATGAPTISGTVQVGETLTVDTSGIADVDGLSNVQYEYQWLSDDSDISGATNATYTLAAVDEGKAIKVEASFTDDAGNNETLTSAATDAVAAAPTPNSPATGAPTISGTAQVGETLTADTADIADADGLAGATFSYQWLGSRDTEIQGATNATYTLAADDEGKTIKVRVTFTDDAGNEESLTSAATDAVAAAPPPPPDNVGAVTQKSGAVELTWEAPDDATVIGYRIERRRADEDRSGPQRSGGRPRDNHTLVEDTASADTGYTDESAEKGVEYEYRVSARNESGPGEGSDWVRAGPGTASNTPATGAPAISGTTQVGETLTADITGIADADGLSGETFTYQWVSGDGTTDTDIEKATGSTYKLVAADQGRSVKVRVTFTDGGGNEETLTSAPTGPVWGDGRPGAPRNLAATPGNKEVTLSWDPPADNGNAPAKRYRIEWRVDGKDYDKTIWGTARSTTYTTNVNANLANGVKYFFRVSAGNGSGNSQGPYGPASGEVSATPTSGSAVDLGTPVLSNTETLHHGMVQLDWEDVEDAGWYVVQYYHIDGGSGEWVDLPAEGVDIAFHGSSAVVSDLHGLSWLRVGAASCDGASEWSQIEQLFGTNASDWEGVPVPDVEEGDGIEPCPVVLGTPVLSDTETLHHGMVRLDWQDIEDAGWYVVQYYHVKGGEWLDLPAEGVDIAFHGSSAVVSNLHGLSWLRVRAMSCAGESEWSQIEQLFGTNASDWEGVPVPEVEEGDEIEPCSEDADTSDNSPVTGAPTISGTARVGETLTADTSGVVDADGLSNVQYEYQWLADDADISGATNATYTLVAGDEGKAIKVEVSFTDDAGNDESLTSEPTTVVAAAPPPPPDNVRAVAQKSGAVELTWDAPQDATVTGYRIERRPTGGTPSDQGRSAGSPRDNHTLVEDTGSADTGYTDNTAQKGVGYEYRVSARNEAGAGEESDWVNAEEATASDSTATGAPTISGTAQVGEILTADTSGIADEDGLSNVQYEYQWLADDSEIAGATDLTYTLTDSEESKAITVRVSFTDDAGNEEALTSAATAAVAGAQPTEPPDKPTGLEATATHDSVTLAWDDPGDDSITGYVILRRIPGVDPEGHFDVLVADTGTDATTYTDDTVSAETRYTYRIKAINGAGTSERSRWSHIDVPAAPVPDKPTGLEATESDGQVTLTWDDPGDDSITGYVILRRVRENNTGGDFSVLVSDTGSAATTYTDDTVAAGTTYTYRIKAINEHGTSERSRWYHIDIPAAP